MLITRQEGPAHVLGKPDIGNELCVPGRVNSADKNLIPGLMGRVVVKRTKDA